MNNMAKSKRTSCHVTVQTSSKMDEREKSQETLEANEESGRTLSTQSCSNARQQCIFWDVVDTERESSSSSSLNPLDWLHVPPVSSLAWENKAYVNSPPPVGKKQSSGQSLKAPYAPKGIIPSQHVYEFPEKQLVVSADKLFCKRSVIEKPYSVQQAHKW